MASKNKPSIVLKVEFIGDLHEGFTLNYAAPEPKSGRFEDVRMPIQFSLKHTPIKDDEMPVLPPNTRKPCIVYELDGYRTKRVSGKEDGSARWFYRFKERRNYRALKGTK